MEIQNSKNYNLKLQKMKQLIEQIQSQKEIKTNDNQNTPLSNQKNSSDLTTIFSYIDKNMDKSIQTLLFKNWLEMDLPLKKKYISKLINYINLKNNISPESLIKSFAFLIKNKLPLLPELIKGTASNLDSHNSLSEILVSASSEQAEENGSLPKNIQNKLTFKLNLSPEEIAQKLKTYPENLEQIIDILKQNENKKGTEKLLHHLLGQQSLNSSEVDRENNILLNLELPVIFKENDNPLPLHLQIKKYNQKPKDKSQNKKSFKISFIIDLGKKGPVKADIIIYSGHIQCQFLTLSSTTADIIETTFPLLEKKLETLGFQVENPLIKQVESEKKFNNQKSPSDSNSRQIKKETNKVERFIHFDFKI